VVIVLIHWRIKPDVASEAAFLEFWRTVARISDKTNLIGEFLSAPVLATNFPFLVDDFSAGHSQGACKHFMNIGLWRDWKSFEQEVGKYFDDAKPMQPFEAQRRTRTVLEPKEWRRGEAALTNTSTCG
jgi:hypothetical protein